jgi:hypothetical protein
VGGRHRGHDRRAAGEYLQLAEIEDAFLLVVDRRTSRRRLPTLSGGSPAPATRQLFTMRSV